MKGYSGFVARQCCDPSGHYSPFQCKREHRQTTWHKQNRSVAPIHFEKSEWTTYHGSPPCLGSWPWLLTLSVTGLDVEGDSLARQGAQHQVEGGLLLDVVIRKGAAILQLLACKDQALLVRWDPLLVYLQFNPRGVMEHPGILRAYEVHQSEKAAKPGPHMSHKHKHQPKQGIGRSDAKQKLLTIRVS